jgi:hypothetical protein
VREWRDGGRHRQWIRGGVGSGQDAAAEICPMKTSPMKPAR